MKYEILPVRQNRKSGFSPASRDLLPLESKFSLLQDDFQVVCVFYDGYDETEDTVFPDMVTEAEKIEVQHEELLVCYPEEWVDEVKRCLKTIDPNNS